MSAPGPDILAHLLPTTHPLFEAFANEACRRRVAAKYATLCAAAAANPEDLLLAAKRKLFKAQISGLGERRRRRDAELKCEEIGARFDIDNLTELPRRSRQEGDFLEQASEADRNGQTLVVVLLDIDHFKGVNDKHGHVGGDAALQTVANALRDSLRQTDRVYRHGGEEFLVMARVADKKDARRFVERLRRAVRETPCLYKGKTIRMTASFGVAMASPSHGRITALDVLIEEADQALYVAKNAGRDRIVVSGESKKNLVTRNDVLGRDRSSFKVGFREAAQA